MSIAQLKILLSSVRSGAACPRFEVNCQRPVIRVLIAKKYSDYLNLKFVFGLKTIENGFQ